MEEFEEEVDLDTDSDSDSSSDSDEDSADETHVKSQAVDSPKSSSSSDEDMEVDLEDVEKQLAEVNEQLLASPFHYDLLVKKIELLRLARDDAALRRTRETMSEYYPLNEELWLSWIQDELKDCTTTEEKAGVAELFERAVQDYLSVEVWLEYIKFTLSRMGEDDGIQKCRDICERALAVAGLHVPLGSLLWDAYRDFEAAVLGLPLSVEESNLQEKRYISLCRRQISVPLFGMEETFEDISSKIDIDDAAKQAYSTALQKFKSVESYETELANANANDVNVKSAIYKKYVEAELKEKCNPARIQCLYERAAADCPLDSSVWLAYLNYVANNLKIPDIILNVALRATRNCSWDLECWTEYLAHLEKLDPSKLISVFEKAILNFTTAEQIGTLWLKYLESLRRLVRINGLVDKEVEKFCSTADAAERHILQISPNSEPNEYIFQAVMMKLRLSAYTSKAMTEVREYWKDLLERGYGYSFRNWLQYLLLERQFGDDSSYRQCLSRAVSYIKDDLQGIADLWLNFERDNGDVTQLRACEKKIAKYLNFVTLADTDAHNNTWKTNQKHGARMDSQPRKNKRKAADDSGVPPKKQKQKGHDLPDGKAVNTVQKSKLPSEQKKTQGPSTSQEFESRRVLHDSSKDDRTVFVSNLAFSVTEDQIQDFFKAVGSVAELRLVKDFKGRSKGYAYVVFESHESVAKALAKDREGLSGRPVFVSKCDADKSTRSPAIKFPSKLEKNKLFVKGLPPSMDVEALRKLFSPFGALKDVRLVTFRNGHSKGLAYVDFEDEKDAARALEKMNETDVGGNIISVAISNPPPKKESGKDVPSDMLILQRRAPSAFVPRSLQVQKKTESSNVFKKPMTNQEFKELFASRNKE